MLSRKIFWQILISNLRSTLCYFALSLKGKFFEWLCEIMAEFYDDSHIKKLRISGLNQPLKKCISDQKFTCATFLMVKYFNAYLIRSGSRKRKNNLYVCVFKHSKSSQSSVKIQPKCSQNAANTVKIHPKFSQNSVKIQSKFSQNSVNSWSVCFVCTFKKCMAKQPFFSLNNFSSIFQIRMKYVHFHPLKDPQMKKLIKISHKSPTKRKR